MFIKQSRRIFFCIITFLLFVGNGYSFNRFFKISPGIRIAGLATDIDSRVPDNGTSTRFEFGGGFNLDIHLEKIITLELDFLYIRKGSEAGGQGSRLTFHYISIPTLVKLWVSRKKFAFVIGPVHNFLVGASGKLASPNVDLNASNTNIYDLGFAFGLHYILANFGDGVSLVGDFRFEFGLINAYKQFRPELFHRSTPYLAIGLNF